MEDHEEVRAASQEPTICRHPGRRVNGLLVREASDVFLRRLDGYYGPNYRRQSLPVCSKTGTTRAQAYSLARKRRTPEGAIDSLPPSSVRRSTQSRPRNL